MQARKALAALGAALMLFVLISSALGEVTASPAPAAPEQTTAAPEEAAPTPTAEPAFDPRAEGGYLPEGMAPYHFKDWASGYWLYVTQNLRVEITRYQRTQPSKLVWYIADIRSESDAMHTISYNPDKPGRSNGMPEDIALFAKAVYAQSGDFYTYRLNNGERPGIIIRDGKILYKKTYAKYTLAIPDLSTAAFLPNGDMKVFESPELTAQEYLDMGARDVLSFGPILIRSGTINPTMYTNFTHLEPRSAIGIITPGHYVGILVEGRTSLSDGCDLKFLAETLQNLGCTDALNLDGGGTAAMVFMGESVQLGSGQDVTSSTRAIPDVLAIGTYH